MDLCESYRFSMTTLVTRIRFSLTFSADVPAESRLHLKYLGTTFDTIKMSLLGSFVGGVLAIPFAILASSNLIKIKL